MPSLFEKPKSPFTSTAPVPANSHQSYVSLQSLQ